MEILIRDLETPKPKRFMDLEIGDPLYCLFGSNAIVQIKIKNIIRDANSSITFVGSKERLIGYVPHGTYNWNDIRWHIEHWDICYTACFDTSTTLHKEKKILRRNIAFSNKAFRNRYVKKMLKS